VRAQQRTDAAKACNPIQMARTCVKTVRKQAAKAAFMHARSEPT
jgi:hypothetical protein